MIKSLLLASAAFLSGGLQQVNVPAVFDNAQQQCAQALTGDYVACPAVFAYEYPDGTSLDDVKTLITQNFGYNLRPASDRQATDLLNVRINGYAELLRQEPGEGNYNQYVQSTSMILNGLVNVASERTSTLYIEPNTTWGPNIEASAAVVINTEHRTVYLFLIGDKG